MPKNIIVKPGETLSGIAKRELGSAGRWKELGAQIGITTEEQARFLKPGTVLTIPDDKVEGGVSFEKMESEKPEVVELRKKIDEISKMIEEKSALLERAKAAKLKAEEEIPDWVVEAKTPEEVAAMVKPKRIEKLEELAFAPPPKSYEEIFREVYEKIGLEDVKKKIEDINNQIKLRKQKLFMEEGDILEDPWTIQATKNQRLRRLYEMARKDIEELNDEKRVLIEQYNEGIKTAKEIAEGSLKDWEKQQKIYKAELDYLVKSGKGDEFLSVSEAKALGLPYGTTKAEAMKMKIIPQEKINDWTEFSDREKRKLRAVGIDWTTPEGWMRAAEYLGYLKEEKPQFKDIEKQAEMALEALRGPGGFVDINAYRELKTEWIRQLGGKGSLFDELYARKYLSPKDASVILKESEAQKLRRILFE